MNKQTQSHELQQISQEDAAWLINKLAGEPRYALEYYAWPRVYGNTAGPFSKPGMVSGQAMSTFTLECWTDGEYTVVFCKGNVVEVLRSSTRPFNPQEYRT